MRNMLIGDHPVSMFLIKGHAFFKQLLGDIIDLLGNELLGKKGTLSPIGDHALGPVWDRGDPDGIAMPVKQLFRQIGMVRLNGSERLPLLNDRSPTLAGMKLLNQMLPANARRGNLNASAVHDCHSLMLLLSLEGSIYISSSSRISGARTGICLPCCSTGTFTSSSLRSRSCRCGSSCCDWIRSLYCSVMRSFSCAPSWAARYAS